MSQKPIGLADLIQKVREELLQPPKDEDALPLLGIEEIELEIGVTVSLGGEAGINIQVVNLGVTGDRTDVHTVRVKMVPLIKSSERLEALKRDKQYGEMVRQADRAFHKDSETASPDADEYRVVSPGQ